MPLETLQDAFAAIVAVQAKLGTSASTPPGGAAALHSDAEGESAYRITEIADIDGLQDALDSIGAGVTAKPANTFYAGPASGAAALPTFRALVAADLPTHAHAIADVVNLQAALDAKAAIASPTFTGTPAAPTAAQGTNTTQLATTAFVRSEVAALVASAPGALDTLDELAAALGDDANFATTVTNSLALKAGLGSANIFTAAQVIQSNAVAAFSVGPNGAANPVLQVDGSVASAATGIKVTPAAAGGGVTLQAISSGANEQLTLQSLGAGRVVLTSAFATPGGYSWNLHSTTLQTPRLRITGVDRLGEIGANGSGDGLALFGNTTLEGATAHLRWISGGTNYGGVVGVASGVLRLTNTSTGAGQLLIGTSSETASGQLSVYSASTTRPGLKVQAASGTAATQEMLGVYDGAAALAFSVRADGIPAFIAGNTQTTVGAAGGAAALPATPTGYLKFNVGGTTFAVPYYAAS